MKKIMSCLMWPVIHVAIYWAFTWKDPWFEPLISERLAISFWHTLPYVSLWFLLMPAEHRDANRRRILIASAAMGALFAATAVYSTWIDNQPAHKVSDFFYLQWPAVGLTVWYVCHCMMPKGSNRLNVKPLGRFKNSRFFLWAPWLQFFWSTLILWDDLGGEYGQIVFLLVLFGSGVYLPLLFLALLGQHLPGTRPVANVGNGVLWLISFLGLGSLVLFDKTNNLITITVIVPLMQMLAACVTTLTAYVRLKNRHNRAMENFSP